MKYIKTFFESISQYKFVKVNDNKTMFKPSFRAKKGTTDFYQILLDDKPVAEIEVKPISKNGKPEIMSAYCDIKGEGLGKMLVQNILDIYLKDEIFVETTTKSRPFWIKMGATIVNNQNNEYLYHFIK